MSSFNGDVAGKLRNTYLPKTKGIYALFEAVVNSLQSIEDMSSNEKPYIHINVIRNEVLNNEFTSNIRDIEIIDNGEGFTEENFNSFKKFDSTHKISKGCKGLGRFAWLKVFDTVSINSIYNNGKKEITFNFIRSKDELNETIKDVDFSENKTTISLKNIIEPYKSSFPQELNRIAHLIIEHCLLFFMGNNCPEITISDNKENLNLNELYKKFYTSDKNTSKFTIGDFDFDTISIRLYETETRNVIAYTSNRRVITSENIGKSIETLNGKIKDGNDSYYYNLIVSGKYLDENIHPSQMEFSIPEEYDENGDFFDVSNPSFSQIRSECLETVKKELSGYLEVSTNNKKEKLIDYVKNHKPGYRVLIDRIKNKKFPFDRLPNNPNMQEMELFLHNLKFQEEKELLALRNKLKKSTKLNEKTKQTYDEAMRKYIAKSSGINTCELSNYICNRKALLDVFEQMISFNKEENKFLDESYLHELIVPMKINSNSVEFEANNLWLLDEKLVFHEALYSDELIKNYEELQSTSARRPDITIFNKPLKYTDDLQYKNSITVVEFKKPGLNNFSEDYNPHREIIRNIKEIISGNATDHRGRKISINGSTRFYGYIVTDITPKIESDLIDLMGYQKSPDGDGFFKYHPLEGCIVSLEIITYEKMFNDARKKNEIFFRILGLN